MARLDAPFDMQYGPFENAEDRQNAFAVFDSLDALTETDSKFNATAKRILLLVSRINSEESLYSVASGVINRISTDRRFNIDSFYSNFFKLIARKIGNSGLSISFLFFCAQKLPPVDSACALQNINEIAASLTTKDNTSLATFRLLVDRLRQFIDFIASDGRSLYSDLLYSVNDFAFEIKNIMSKEITIDSLLNHLVIDEKREEHLIARSNIFVALELAMENVIVERYLPAEYSLEMTPGEFLRYIIALNASTVTDIASAFDADEDRLHAIIHSQCEISSEIAFKLDGLHNITARQWLNVQTAYSLERVKNLDARMASNSEYSKEECPDSQEQFANAKSEVMLAAPTISSDELSAFRAFAKSNKWNSASDISPSEFITKEFGRWVRLGLPLTEIREAQDNLAVAYSTEIKRHPERKIEGLYVRPHRLPGGVSPKPRRAADLTEAELADRRAKNAAAKARSRLKASRHGL